MNLKNAVRKAFSCVSIILYISSCSSGEVRINACDKFSIQLPENWMIEKIDYPFFKTDNAFGLKSSAWKNLIAETENDYYISDYPVYISVYSGSIEKSGKEYGWTFEEGMWYISGKSGNQTAGELKEGRSYNYLSGESIVGTRTKFGSEFFSSVAATAFITVIDDKKGTLIVITADVFFMDKVVFDQIVNSIRVNSK